MTTGKNKAPDRTWERIGNEIRRIRSGRDVGLNQFADQVGMSPSGLSRLERGEQKASLDLLSAIAQQLEVPLSRIFAIAEGAIMSVELPTILPVINVEQVKSLMQKLKKGLATMETCTILDLPFTAVADAAEGKEFILELRGGPARAMAPTYQPGDQARISTITKPEPGDHVVALVKSEPHAVFRVYRPHSDGTIELAAINPDWPSIIIDNGNPGDIIGVMTERRHIRRHTD